MYDMCLNLLFKTKKIYNCLVVLNLAVLNVLLTQFEWQQATKLEVSIESVQTRYELKKVGFFASSLRFSIVTLELIEADCLERVCAHIKISCQMNLTSMLEN